jgi:predicted RNA-binding Zn-ribbon protein involved in translation (DUF1610 family)
MASKADYVRSAVKGCNQLAKLLENFTEEGCPNCGHGNRLSQDKAHQLDIMIWEALRFAEMYQ